MTRRCTVCDHPDLADIDAALVGASVPFRTIAHAHGLTHWSAMRHAQAHIPALLVESNRAEVAASADTLLDRVDELEAVARKWHAEAELLLTDARADVDSPLVHRNNAIKTGILATREIGHCLELLAKVSGLLQQNTTNVTVNNVQLEVQIRAALSIGIEVVQRHASPEVAQLIVAEWAKLLPGGEEK